MTIGQDAIYFFDFQLVHRINSSMETYTLLDTIIYQLISVGDNNYVAHTDSGIEIMRLQKDRMTGITKDLECCGLSEKDVCFNMSYDNGLLILLVYDKSAEVTKI